jgi:ATP-dependent 26S proteasome regulatory subunit
MNPNNFIDYLDKYKNKQNMGLSEYVTMIQLINNHYFNEQLNNKKNQDEDNINYYSLYSNSTWNYPVNACDSNTSTAKSVYSLWQSKYQVDISTNVTREKVHIGVNITSIEDLIKIINDNPYSVTKEYNIDLNALHNIKVELSLLNNMIGMSGLKKSVLEQLIYFMQGLHKTTTNSEFKHTVIYGPPGTGKTEVAKVVGQMYSKMGILKNNCFKKVTRSDLIAGYLGQTAIKTKKVIEECLGGVLFIDEAYSLSPNGDSNDSYSKECIDTICEALSDHKDDLMVIIAGYEEELEQTFFRANRGLESRFIWRFKMDKYTPLEMMKIFKKMVLDNEWQLECEATITEKWFNDKKENFKYFGRDMELLLTYTKISHGNRVYGKPIELRKKITIEDLNRGYEIFIQNKGKKQEPHFMHSIYV